MDSGINDITDARIALAKGLDAYRIAAGDGKKMLCILIGKGRSYWDSILIGRFTIAHNPMMIVCRHYKMTDTDIDGFLRQRSLLVSKSRWHPLQRKKKAKSIYFSCFFCKKVLLCDEKPAGWKMREKRYGCESAPCQEKILAHYERVRNKKRRDARLGAYYFTREAVAASSGYFDTGYTMDDWGYGLDGIRSLTHRPLVDFSTQQQYYPPQPRGIRRFSS